MEVLIDGLQPQEAKRYLEAARWLQVGSDGCSAIYEHSSGRRVLLPLIEAADTADLLRIAVRAIAEAEDRTEEDVVADLTWPGYDRLDVHRAVVVASLSLADGVRLHDAVQAVIRHGSRSLRKPQRRYAGGGLPQDVRQYMERARLLPSAPGSFTVRLLLPLESERDDGPQQLSLGTEDDPPWRGLTKQVMAAARSGVDTAKAVAAADDFSLWDDAVSGGVSANLCQALSQLPGAASSSDAAQTSLRVSWSSLAPAEPLPEVVIPAEISSVLDAGSDYLRGMTGPYIATFTGSVVSLHREQGHGRGEVTIQADTFFVQSGRGPATERSIGEAGHGGVKALPVQDGAPGIPSVARERRGGEGGGVRPIRVALEAEQYRRAIDAHSMGRRLRVTATVSLRPRGAQAASVRELQLVE